jgi:hypothetical protein
MNLFCLATQPKYRNPLRIAFFFMDTKQGGAALSYTYLRIFHVTKASAQCAE